MPTFEDKIPKGSYVQGHTIEASPLVLSRIAGVLYLVIIVLTVFAEVSVRGKIFVPGDAATTVANLVSMEPLWRLGIAAQMLAGISTVLMTLALYLLLRPVSKELALLVIFFNLIGVTVDFANTARLGEALLPLGNAEFLKVFAPEQLYALANLSMSAHVNGASNSMLLYGPFCLVTGYLIFKSGYFPKIIGVLYVIAGLSYMTNNLSTILAPAFANQIHGVLAFFELIGEMSVCLWLLVKGVNLEKWKIRTGAA